MFITWDQKLHHQNNIKITSSPWAVRLSWQHVTYKPSKLGQIDLILVCDQS